MAKKNTGTKKAKDQQIDDEIKAAMNQPWLQMRTGLIVMTLGSIIFAIFITWQLQPTEGWLRAIGWGLLFGGAMWAIFFVGLWFQRFVRREKK